MNDQTDPLGETTIDVRPHMDPARTQIIPAVTGANMDAQEYVTSRSEERAEKLAARLRDHFAVSLSGQFPDQWFTVHQLAAAVDVDPGHKQQMRSLYAMLDAMHALGALERSSHGGWLTYRGVPPALLGADLARSADREQWSGWAAVLLDAFLERRPLDFGGLHVPKWVQDRLSAAVASGRLGQVPVGDDGPPDMLDPRELLRTAVLTAREDGAGAIAWCDLAGTAVALAELEHRRRVDQVDDVDEQAAELIRERKALDERERVVAGREEHVAFETDRIRKLYLPVVEVRQVAGVVTVRVNGTEYGPFALSDGDIVEVGRGDGGAR